jgi:hypothetical protein
MAAPREMNICIFKPLRSETPQVGGQLSAHVETKIVDSTGRRQAPLSSLILTAWGILLKSYLATNLVSFASLGMKYLDTLVTEDGNDSQNDPFDEGASQDWIHTLEISDSDSICNVIKHFEESTSRHRFDTTLLQYVNTMILCHPRTTTPANKGMTSMQDATPDFVHQVCLITIQNSENCG